MLSGRAECCRVTSSEACSDCAQVLYEQREREHQRPEAFEVRSGGRDKGEGGCECQRSDRCVYVCVRVYVCERVSCHTEVLIAFGKMEEGRSDAGAVCGDVRGASSVGSVRSVGGSDQNNLTPP